MTSLLSLNLSDLSDLTLDAVHDLPIELLALIATLAAFAAHPVMGIAMFDALSGTVGFQSSTPTVVVDATSATAEVSATAGRASFHTTPTR